MTVVMIGGTPSTIQELEKKLERFERLHAVQYERREKHNSCAYTLHFEPGKEPDAELIKIMTISFNKLFVTIVNEKSSRLFYEGKEIKYEDE